jgi:hypothetical protein
MLEELVCCFFEDGEDVFTERFRTELLG